MFPIKDRLFCASIRSSNLDSMYFYLLVFIAKIKEILNFFIWLITGSRFERIKSRAMEVTKENFESVLPNIKKSIEEATFLTIDCELTGLNTKYSDQRFLCQSSSIDFLISQGFDFNKLFKEGIPYLNLEEETKYQENIEERNKPVTSSSYSNSNSDKIAIPPEDKPFIDDIIKTVKTYLKYSDQESIQLPKCNPFLRKLIYQTIGEVFGSEVCVETKQLENKDRVMYVSRVKSEEELEAKAKQKFDEESKILDESVGFTKVLREVVNSGKLVVGHNMMLDLLHTVDKFLTPLPEDYHEFKDCAHALFNNILDTKFMSSSETFKDTINSTVLGHLYDSIRQDPFVIPDLEIESGCESYSLDAKKDHEAAFDAFITGVSFLAMWNYLGRENNLSPDETFSDFNLLRPYMNKIYLMRLQDNQYIHLGGVDPNPSRDHVFHVSFPKEWKVNDIQQFFSPFGNVFISWINDSSAFVGLYKRDQATLAYTTLCDDETCVVTPFAKFQNEDSPTSANRRGSHGSPNICKKRRITTSSSKDSLSEKVLEKKTKRKVPKTFSESDLWE
ncbi:hypothetical protein HHI36_014165 [Cryptolaemus montrouzieri]|uniref:Poly(A)-specific ribonuclease RNA-binding domain-containing protein n=1 Tax=Cryptolaemus montrouzieri TaxID=559131 RepID=A0ABD2N202_9CUCU